MRGGYGRQQANPRRIAGEKQAHDGNQEIPNNEVKKVFLSAIAAD